MQATAWHALQSTMRGVWRARETQPLSGTCSWGDDGCVLCAAEGSTFMCNREWKCCVLQKGEWKRCVLQQGEWKCCVLQKRKWKCCAQQKGEWKCCALQKGARSFVTGNGNEGENFPGRGWDRWDWVHKSKVSADTKLLTCVIERHACTGCLQSPEGDAQEHAEIHTRLLQGLERDAKEHADDTHAKRIYRRQWTMQTTERTGK